MIGTRIKINPADKAFSDCLREAHDWVCEGCGKQYEQGSQGLHCSHIFSRRHRTIRWCKDNAQALCFNCHQWYGGNPADSGEWVVNLKGEDFINRLRIKKEMRQKVLKIEEKEIAKHYREQLKIIEQKRLDGVLGYIDFESWQ